MTDISIERYMKAKLLRYSQLPVGAKFTFYSDIICNPLHLCMRTENGYNYFEDNKDTYIDTEVPIGTKERPFNDPEVLIYINE